MLGVLHSTDRSSISFHQYCFMSDSYKKKLCWIFIPVTLLDRYTVFKNYSRKLFKKTDIMLDRNYVRKRNLWETKAL